MPNTRRRSEQMSDLQYQFATHKSRGWTRLWLLLPVALLPLGDAPPRSQQSSRGSTISVDVKMVSMLATVRDKHGLLIRNLTKDDFVVKQDGHPQTIAYFAQDSNLPLSLGLLVDTSMSQRRLLDQERSASHAFIDHALREDKDKAFVIQFAHEVELLQDLTSSRQKLEASLEQLGVPEFAQTAGGDDSSGGRGSHNGGSGTLLYDAVYLASNELMKKQQGRKALIILSDGVDRGSKETLQDSIETAQRADTLVYSILFADKEDYGNRGGYAGGTWVAREWAAAIATTPRNRAPMARKFSNKYPEKQAAASLKSPKKKRSIESTPRLTRNCAISTAWATPPIKSTLRRDITRSISP